MSNGQTVALIITVVIAALIAAGFLLSRALTRRFMHIALDRTLPGDMERAKELLSGNVSYEEITARVEKGAAYLLSSGCEEIHVTAPDGIDLVGHWYECEHAERAIIVMHGWRSSWLNDFGIIAEFWHKNNCSVLYAEQRGQGNSGGDYMSFGVLEQYDCLEWIRYVDQRTDGRLPLYLGGISMGATTVLLTGGMELPDSVRGIVADCGFTSPHDIWKHVAEKNLHLPYSFHRTAANEICRKKLKVDMRDYSCVCALKKCRVPVMLIHGTDDSFVPVHMTYENYKACASEKRLFVVPGADHAMSYLVDQEGYEKAVKDFWADYDKINC